MALKIAYTFIAEDRFSKVVAKMSEQATKLQGAMSNINKSSEKMNKSQASLNKSFNKHTKVLAKLNTLMDKYKKKSGEGDKKTKSFAQRVKLAAVKFTQFGTALSKLADKFGMAAYFRLMNIALPMGVVAKYGMDYASSLNRANASMTSLFGNSKRQMKVVQAIRKESGMLGTTTGFSKADIMSAASFMASSTGNILAAKAAIPAMITLARIQHTTLQQAAQNILGGMRSGRIAGTAIYSLHGTQTDRFMQALAQIQKLYSAGAASLLDTTPVQLAIISVQLKKIAATILTQLLPAFKGFAHILDVIVPKVTNFIKVHKTLMKWIGYAVIAVLGYLTVLMSLGVIIGTLAAPFEILARALKIFTLLSIWLRVVKVALISLQGAFIAVSAVIEATPLGWLLTALAALGIAVYELYKHWDQVTCAIEKAIKATIEFASLAIHSPKTAFHEAVHAMTQPDIGSAIRAYGHPSTQKQEVHVHIHDSNANVSHVDSKNVPTTLHQALYAHQLGHNMGGT